MYCDAPHWVVCGYGVNDTVVGACTKTSDEPHRNHRERVRYVLAWVANGCDATTITFTG